MVDGANFFPTWRTSCTVRTEEKENWDPSGATTHIHSIDTENKHFHTKADLELCGDHHPGHEKWNPWEKGKKCVEDQQDLFYSWTFDKHFSAWVVRCCSGDKTVREMERFLVSNEWACFPSQPHWGRVWVQFWRVCVSNPLFKILGHIKSLGNGVMEIALLYLPIRSYFVVDLLRILLPCSIPETSLCFLG